MVNRSTVLTLTAFLLGAAGATARAATVYVDASMLPGVGRGTSWGDAFERVQQGIDAALAAGGGEVWVREGTYYENVGIPDGVAVYGGFAGTETSLSERDWRTNVTILSGDIGRSGDDADNSYHVVTAIEAAKIFDGFTVRDGNANGESFNSSGGGNNRGGGMQVNHVVSCAHLRPDDEHIARQYAKVGPKAF